MTKSKTQKSAPVPGDDTQDFLRQLTVVRRFEVEVVGTTALLFNRPLVEDEDKKNIVKEDLWEKEKRTWRNKLYSDSEGLFFPAECVHEGLKASAQYWNQRVPGERYATYTKKIKMGCITSPFRILTSKGLPIFPDDPQWVLFLDKFVPLPKAGGKRMLRRPLIPPGWTGRTEIITTDGRLDLHVMGSVLSIMGQFNGLGDWRQYYGKFEISKLKEK